VQLAGRDHTDVEPRFHRSARDQETSGLLITDLLLLS
jgi:hypothetical protein